MGAGGSEGAGANLAKVDHVVVMMLENRSFDHMLGYLSLTGRHPEVDGPTSGVRQLLRGAQLPGLPPRHHGGAAGPGPFLARDRHPDRGRRHERLRRPAQPRPWSSGGPTATRAA